MRSLVRCGVVLCLALLGSVSVRGQATLNLSHDLVALGIAASNMVPNQPSLDAGPLFVAGVEYAKTHGIATVIADKGAYYFLTLTEPNAHFALRNIDNMTIDLQGSDLIFTQPLFYGWIVYYSTNAVIQNFTADYQPLPFTQLRVLAVDVPHALIQYSLEPGWSDPGLFNSLTRYPGAPVPQVQVHMFRSGRRVLGRLFSPFPLDGGGKLSIVDTDPGTRLGDVRAGDVAVVVLRTFTNAVGTNHCNGCTLRNITVFSSAEDAVHTQDSQNSVMERVYTIPKPGTDRLVSASAGIMMFPIAGPNNQIRLSRAIRTNDDGLALVGLFVGTVQSQSSARVFVMDGSGGPSILGDVDSIANGSPVTFQRYSDGGLIASAVIVSQTTPAASYPHQATFTFDRDLPMGVIGAAVYTTDPSQNGANSVVERSLIQEPFGRLYIGGLANSIARGNYIRRTALSGVFLYQSTAPGDTLTAPLTNMTVSNNVIDGTNMVSDWWWFQFAAIQSVTLTTAADLMTGSLFSNLNITNNFIADSGRSGVWLGNTNGGNVTGNYLLNPNARPDTANAYGGRPGDALRPLVVDTTSAGVTVSGTVIDTASGRVIVTDAQFNELAAYAPGSTIRLSAFNVGALASPAVTLTDADGVMAPATIRSVSPHAIDVQVPTGAALGGAYVTVTSGAQKYFGTLFVDSQDNIPAVNGCTFDASPSATAIASAGGSVSHLVVTQAGCAYQVVDGDSYVTAGGGGTGTGVVSVTLAANTFAARTTTIEIAGRPFTITQQSAAQPTLNLSRDLIPLGIAATNMVPNQPSLDAGPLFLQGVAYAKAHGITTVLADPGAYYFLTEQQPFVSVPVNQLSNLTIDFQGADLYFAAVNTGFLFTACTNLIVENFTVDHLQPGYTQLRVTSVDAIHRQINFTVQPGWQNPTALNALLNNPAIGSANPAPTDVFVFRNGRLWDNYTPMPLQQPFNDDHLVIGPNNFVTSSILSSIRPGDIAVLRVRVGEAAIDADCTGCTFRNIRIYSGFVGFGLNGPSPSSVLERIYVMPRPGTDRLVSTLADGITVAQPGPNITVRLSRSIRTLDDGISPHTFVWGSVQSVPSARIAVITGAGITAFGRPLPVSSNVAFERASDGAILGNAVITAESSITTVNGVGQATVTFDRNLPSDVTGAFIYATDASWRGDGLRLERNTVQEQGFARGISLWGLMNTTVSGSYLHRTAMSAVNINHTLGVNDWLVPPLSGITLANNVVDGTPTELDSDPRLELASIEAVGSAPNFSMMTGSPNQNLTFTGNFIANAPRSAFYIGNTTDANVTNNYLLHPNINPRQDRSGGYNAATFLKPIAIENSVNVSTTANPVDTTSGQVGVTDTQYRELAAYAPGGTVRLNAYNLGALVRPTASITDADGITRPMIVQSTFAHALDVQIPAAALGGAYLTITSGESRYFGTLFLDNQDNIPALNGCVYEVSPSSRSVPGTATTLAILVVTQAGCSYQMLASDAFVTAGAGGTSTAVINVGFAANSGDAARTTTIEVAGQPFTIRQAGRPVASDLSLDTPMGGAVSMPFPIAGWALNRAAASGTGVDAVHVYATLSGGSPVFLGVATYGGARSDIGTIFGSQFTNAGWALSSGGSLTPGPYTISVFAHNASTGTFDAAASANVTVTAPVSKPAIAVDTPTAGQTVTSAFEVGGWALDAGGASGTGVDGVTFYVQPAGAPAPGIFIGTGSYGAGRGDVAALYGSRFTTVGFHFTITGMSPGTFTLNVVAHSTVTNSNSIVKSVPFTVSATALMSIDAPSAEATISAATITIGGWSIDRTVENTTMAGSGVDAVHIYAFPNPGSGQAPIFLGVATLGASRPDVGAFYGSRYGLSGYNLTVDRGTLELTPGVYSIGVVSHSAVTGTFNNTAVVRVTLQ